MLANVTRSSFLSVKKFLSFSFSLSLPFPFHHLRVHHFSLWQQQELIYRTCEIPLSLSLSLSIPHTHRERGNHGRDEDGERKVM